MAYSTGILLAAGGDVYTQLMDIIKAFCETAGWSSNMYADDSSYYDAGTSTYHASGATYTGKRLHLQKEIAGTVRYANLRSTQGQKVFRYSECRVITGLAVCGSQGYDAGVAWDQQPGVTSSSGTVLSYAVGAGVDFLSTSSLTYYLFSYNGDNTIYCQIANAYGYVGFAFGVTSTGNYFVAGSGGYGTPSGFPVWAGLLFSRYNYGDHVFSILDGTTWRYCRGVDEGAASLSAHIPRVDSINTSGLIGRALVALLLYCSPDSFKGNAPLIPAYIRFTAATGPTKSAGVFPGVKYVNMKNIASLTEVTYGADTYKLFRQYGIDDANDATGGLAFLIS